MLFLKHIDINRYKKLVYKTTGTYMANIHKKIQICYFVNRFEQQNDTLKRNPADELRA